MGESILTPRKRAVGKLFLDSGAHSLYNKFAFAVDYKKERSGGEALDWLKAHATGDRYAWFKTKAFRRYVDDYARFILKYKGAIDHYVNVDVINNPELTWRTQKYLEDEWGLNPVPVLHAHAPLKWVERYAEVGYDLIGLGGVSLEGTGAGYTEWADSVFRILCPPPAYLPIVKVHGFAMTSHEMLVRWPWWSVDSSSWAKAGGFGSIYVPRRKGNTFRFDLPPRVVETVLTRSKRKRQEPRSEFWEGGTDRLTACRGQVGHYALGSASLQKEVRAWLEHIGVPLGEAWPDGGEKVWGVVSAYGARGIANLKYYEALCASLPEWPRPFRPDRKHNRAFVAEEVAW